MVSQGCSSLLRLEQGTRISRRILETTFNPYTTRMQEPQIAADSIVIVYFEELIHSSSSMMHGRRRTIRYDWSIDHAMRGRDERRDKAAGRQMGMRRRYDNSRRFVIPLSRIRPTKCKHHLAFVQISYLNHAKIAVAPDSCNRGASYAPIHTTHVYACIANRYTLARRARDTSRDAYLWRDGLIVEGILE